ncbi:hypothetical protein TanjilG_16116 [Lupinus angustifolius]|uniref:Uncharacterized protein n=1 Tax=Lupinus angustifolius TaxID=3871 RepID=A0A1J7ICY1_LUPAN|nr:hypothetical protein TanjilG_16116 [Lupinus angustifolius]
MQVLIPLGEIKEVNKNQNVNKLEQKYIEIVTKDDFEFWFMGFVWCKKILINLHNAIDMANLF